MLIKMLNSTPRRCHHRPNPVSRTFIGDSLTRTTALLLLALAAAFSSLLLTSSMIPGLLSKMIVSVVARDEKSPSSKHSANATPPSSSISLLDKFTTSRDGTSARISAIAEAPSSPNAFPLRSNDTSELPSWTISSARAHAPSPTERDKT
jgi:hypothetical protein